MAKDYNKIVVYSMLVMVLIIIIFNVVGTLAPDISDAGESITDANNCSETTDAAGVEYTYNITDGFCYNSTNGTGAYMIAQYSAGQYDLPFAALFDSDSVLILLMMAMILLAVIGVVFIKKRKS